MPHSLSLSSFPTIAACCCIAASTAQSLAQCGPRWLRMDGFAGVDVVAHTIVEWDPDGAGPRTPMHVIGGLFGAAGNARARNVASYDPTTGEWSAFASGLGNDEIGVDALGVLPDGRLVAAGEGIDGVKVWEGDQWNELEGDLVGSVAFLLTMPNGDLVAAGQFLDDDDNLWSFARWREGVWTLMSGESTSASLVLDHNGHLLTGTSTGVSRWDGAAWHTLPPTGFEVEDLDIFPDGRIAVTGTRTAIWNGATWTTLASDNADHIAAIEDGRIVVAGDFEHFEGAPARAIAQWDGAWSTLGAGLVGQPGLDAEIKCLHKLSDGTLVICGSFSEADDLLVDNMAMLVGAQWTPYGHGMHGFVRALHTAANGDILAAGDFTTAGGKVARGVARWDGAEWTTLGEGVDGPLAAVIELPNGDIVVGGHFESAQGVPAHNIARWDGERWWPLGSGTDGVVHALALTPDGALIAGGQFEHAGDTLVHNIARWDGQSWSPMAFGLGGTFFDSKVRSLLVTSTGELLAAGDFTFVYPDNAQFVARWDGEYWRAMPSSANGEVLSLVELPNGDLYAAGGFPNDVARWNGSAWASLPLDPRGHATVVGSGPDGSLVVGGSFAPLPDRDDHYVLTWNGTNWLPLDPPKDSLYRYPLAFATSPHGEFFIGGYMYDIDGVICGPLARWVADGTPWIVRHPESLEVWEGEMVTLQARPGRGFDDLVYVWSKDGVLLDTSDRRIEQVDTSRLSSLTIHAASVEDAGLYTCTVSNPCGSVSTIGATLVVTPPCPSDYTADTTVDILDFLDFFQDFGTCDQLPSPCGTLGNPDVNGDTVIDILDFLDFLDAFGSGC